MSKTIDRETLPYRPAAGVMLLNRAGKVWVGQRLDSTLEAWQMPQGGLDPGEEAEDGALRELEEETGIPRDKVEILARAPGQLLYDLPDDLLGKIWKGKWRGQRQTWFLMRFIGEDADVNLQTPEPEFRAWKWAEPQELPELIVPFKKGLYRDVLKAFAEWL
jgi:putative (di)nucleoside polyphosphate hydrolase